MTRFARAGGVQLVVNPAYLHRFKKDLDSYDTKLAKELRKRLRNAGNHAREEVIKSLRLPSPDGGPNDGQGRAALIAATRVAVSFSERTAGARIVTSASRLPPEHKGLLNVYNKSSVRHPVFGMDDVWVTQRGRPYFGTVIRKAMNRRLLKEMEAALNDAARAIGGR